MALVEQYLYQVDKIIKYGDGDSFWAVLSKDIGFYVRGQAPVHVRVTHIDTPERGQPLYVEAGEFTMNWLIMNEGKLDALSEKRDEFGRWLCDIYNRETGERLSDALKAVGFAKPGSKWNA